MCYVTDQGAANLVEAARHSGTLAALAAVVTVLLVAALVSSLAALRAAREMRSLRAENANYPHSTGTFSDPTHGKEA